MIFTYDESAYNDDFREFIGTRTNVSNDNFRQNDQYFGKRLGRLIKFCLKGGISDMSTQSSHNLEISSSEGKLLTEVIDATYSIVA